MANGHEVGFTGRPDIRLHLGTLSTGQKQERNKQQHTENKRRQDAGKERSDDESERYRDHFAEDPTHGSGPFFGIVPCQVDKVSENA